MGQPVITVDGHFGAQEITKDDFIKRWTDHVNELKRLDYTMEWVNDVRDMVVIVEKKAAEEFDIMFKKEHGCDLADYRDEDESDSSRGGFDNGSQ